MKKKKSKAAPKAAKVRAKKIEVRMEDTLWNRGTYAFARPGAETYSGGYERPFTAIRAAYRFLKATTKQGVPYNEVKRPSDYVFYTPKGQPIEIIRSYIQPAKHKK